MMQTKFAEPLKHWPCRTRTNAKTCRSLSEPKQGRYGTGDRGASSILRAVGWILHTDGLVSHLLLPHLHFSRRHFLSFWLLNERRALKQTAILTNTTNVSKLAMLLNVSVFFN